MLRFHLMIRYDDEDSFRPYCIYADKDQLFRCLNRAMFLACVAELNILATELPGEFFEYTL